MVFCHIMMWVYFQANTESWPNKVPHNYQHIKIRLRYWRESAVEAYVPKCPDSLLFLCVLTYFKSSFYLMCHLLNHCAVSVWRNCEEDVCFSDWREMCDFYEFPLLVCHSLLKLAMLDVAESDFDPNEFIDCDRKKCCRKYTVEWQDIINPVTQARYVPHLRESTIAAFKLVLWYFFCKFSNSFIKHSRSCTDYTEGVVTVHDYFAIWFLSCLAKIF